MAKMIVWKYSNKNGLTMIYGFAKESDRHYIAVLTLCVKNGSAVLYGFLNDKSKVSIHLKDLWALWDLLCGIVKTKYLIFEVLPEHAALYKQTLPVVDVQKTVTFNGIDSETLKIEVKKVKR